MNTVGIALSPASQLPLLSPRGAVHVGLLGFAFLLSFLTWPEAAAAAILALAFNLFILPQLGVDLGKRPAAHIATASAGERETWTGVILYPISVFFLIVIYRHHLSVAAAAWALMAAGDGAAGVAGVRLGGRKLPWNRRKTWSGSVAFVLAGGAAAWALVLWVNPALSGRKTLVISALAALLGAAVESAPIGLDDNLTVPLVCGGFMFCAWLTAGGAFESNLPFLGRRLALAATVNLAFAVAALRLGAASRAGAALGFVLGTLVYLGWGSKSFAILLAFFLLSSLATRLGYAHKAARGTAELGGGARDWRAAAANVLPGAFFSLLAITTYEEHAFLVALLAAFAEACGDTVSSEIGQWLSPRAWLITSFRPVPAGGDGAVSPAGTLAGVTASALIVLLGLVLGLTGVGGAAIALGAAVAGNLFDSLLGATIERRGLVTNGIVNFAGSSLAGALALAFTLR